MANSNGNGTPPYSSDIEGAPDQLPGSLADMQQPLEGGSIPSGSVEPQPTPVRPPQGPLGNLRAALAARQPPSVSDQAQSHGGLLSGLAGVLLDGLSAGMQAQASAPLYGAPGSNFARGFVANENMPLLKQQRQQQMWDSLTKIEQDKALMAKSYMDQLQTHLTTTRLSDDVVSGMMDADRQMADSAVEQGWGTRMAVTSGPDARKQAMDMVHDQRIKDQNFQNQYFAYPLNHDGQGNATDWQVIKLDPGATLGKDETITYPYLNPSTGQIESGTFTATKDTKVRDFIALREGLIKSATGALGASIKQEEKAGTDLIESYNPQTKQNELVSRAVAQSQNRPDAFNPKVAQSNINTWTTAWNQYRDAQIGVSQYTRAIQAFGTWAQDNPKAASSDLTNLNLLLNKNPALEAKLNIPGLGGVNELPVISPAMEAISRIISSDAWNNLSRPTQNMLMAYQEGLASLPAYQRALMESARAGNNPQQLALDTATWANPLDALKNSNLALQRMGLFQQRINQATSDMPRWPGVTTVDQVRQQYELNYRPGQPENVAPIFRPGASAGPDWTNAPGNARHAQQDKNTKQWYWIDQNNNIIGPVNAQR